MSLEYAYSSALIAATVIAQSAIVAAFTSRRMFREFPVFFAYTCLHIFRALILFLLLKTALYTYGRYLYAYWILDALDFGLTLAAIFEIYSQVFGRYPALKRLGTVMFRWTLAVLVAVAMTVTVLNVGSSGGWFVRAVVSFGLGTSIVKGGLLLFLFLFAKSFGVNWKHYAFGIAMGFALNSIVGLVMWVVRTRFGAISTATASFVLSASYTSAVFIWVTYLFAPVRGAASESAEAGDLDRWNVALEGLLSRGALG